MKKISFLLILGLFAAAASAEMYKKVLLDSSNGQVRVWPKLGQVKGWHQDEYASTANDANAQVPDGFSFGNSATVIYAKAMYKLSKPGIKSLEQYIEYDKKKFLEEKPGIIIKETEPAVTGDKVKLRSFTFFPKDKGEWERVSYGEEGDYYIAFTVSSLSKREYEKVQGDYLRFLRSYKIKM